MKKLLLIFILILFVLPVFSLESNNIVRVGLTDSKFQNVLKQSVIVYGTSECEICDKRTGKVVGKIPANEEISITNSSNGLETLVNGENINLNNYVIICPQGLLGIKGLLRKGKQALYHGAFEIIRNEKDDGFYVVNVIEIQEYLKGVVPNEMPVRFGLEALKAQAVAARNYVLTPRTQAYKDFNVVDSVASQVYYGANTEEDLATRAVMETDGIVALYDNHPILALYSSTAGGYTESYSNAFSEPGTKVFPAPNKPYLSAIPDKSDFEPLDSDEKALKFYESKIPSFDIESPYYRWVKEWNVKELEEIINKTLPVQSKTGFVSPEFRTGDKFGRITDIVVTKRGPSGKAMEVDIHTDKECYRISKELVIRRVFQKDGISLPSANIVVTKEQDNYGNIVNIRFFGGGFGHGVGMSQFGAGYMATKLKQPYYNILRHYYKGINLGTFPVTVFGKEIKQTFWAPIGRAQIVIVDTNAPKIAIMINGKDHEFTITKPLFQKEYKIDISRYIDDGENVIVYYPPSLGRSVTLYVEIVEKYGKSAEYQDDKG